MKYLNFQKYHWLIDILCQIISNNITDSSSLSLCLCFHKNYVQCQEKSRKKVWVIFPLYYCNQAIRENLSVRCVCFFRGYPTSSFTVLDMALHGHFTHKIETQTILASSKCLFMGVLCQITCIITRCFVFEHDRRGDSLPLSHNWCYTWQPIPLLTLQFKLSKTRFCTLMVQE